MTDTSERFLRYRLFTIAVALKFFEGGVPSETIQNPNYLSYRLITDSRVISNENLWSVVENVMPEAVRVLKRHTFHEPEYPFFVLSAMARAAWRQDRQGMRRLARQLIEEEQWVRRNAYVRDDRFLLGLTRNDILHGNWIQLVSDLRGIDDDDRFLCVIDAITQGWAFQDTGRDR